MHRFTHVFPLPPWPVPVPGLMLPCGTLPTKAEIPRGFAMCLLPFLCCVLLLEDICVQYFSTPYVSMTHSFSSTRHTSTLQSPSLHCQLDVSVWPLGDTSDTLWLNMGLTMFPHHARFLPVALSIFTMMLFIQFSTPESWNSSLLCQIPHPLPILAQFIPQFPSNPPICCCQACPSHTEIASNWCIHSYHFFHEAAMHVWQENLQIWLCFLLPNILLGFLLLVMKPKCFTPTVLYLIFHFRPLTASHAAALASLILAHHLALPSSGATEENFSSSSAHKLWFSLIISPQ